MNSPWQSIARTIMLRVFRVFLSILLLFALSPLFHLPLSLRAHPQEKAESDNTIYRQGYSAEDRLKQNKMAPEPDSRFADSNLAPPPNDNFSNPSVGLGIGSNGFLNATNVDGTGETGEPDHGGGTGGSGPDKNSIWYAFTADITGVISITTATNGATPITDTVISAYTGTSVSALDPIAENDDYPGLGFFSRITFGITAGQTYRVAVDGYSSAQGTFSVSYLKTNAALNDNFASAESISGTSSPFIGITGSNVGATGQSGEPNHVGNSGTLNSTWYSWTAPSRLSMTFYTEGSDFDTTISIYTGTSVNALTLIANDDDDGPSNSSRVTFSVASGFTYRIAIEGFGSQVGNTLLNWSINRAESGRQFDFDGDLRTDFSVFRPSTNLWYILKSSGAGFEAIQWGSPGDVLYPGTDFDGDDRADVGVWRPSNGVFYAHRSFDGGLFAMQFGVVGDIPVQGDFDADDRSDFAVWRPSSGDWWIFRSQSQTVLAFHLGQNGDKPAAGDYDGDGETDIAVWRSQPQGRFYIIQSRSDDLQSLFWGITGDVVVPGDYDRDGKNDAALYRPSNRTFYALRSSDPGDPIASQWGAVGDFFVPGDYDGNGYSDISVWRPSNGAFYVLRLPGFNPTIVQWGTAGDVPVANSNVH